MSGFDHSAFAEQVAGGIAYAAGDHRLTFGNLAPLPYTSEPVTAKVAQAYGVVPGDSVEVVALNVASALFAGKLPTEGDVLRDATVDPVRVFRIIKREGGLTHPLVRFVCVASTED